MMDTSSQCLICKGNRVTEVRILASTESPIKVHLCYQHAFEIGEISPALFAEKYPAFKFYLNDMGYKFIMESNPFYSKFYRLAKI
jgi:hypothetical protein